jgi:hypothetical protein
VSDLEECVKKRKTSKSNQREESCEARNINKRECKIRSSNQMLSVYGIDLVDLLNSRRALKTK